MIEALFLLGLLGILLVSVWEWIASQPAMATLVCAVFLVPGVALGEFGRLASIFGLPLRAVRDLRAPNPPEVFYWSLRRSRLLRQCVGLVPFALACWLFALRFPAQLEFTRESVLGWLTGAAAIYASARCSAVTLIYWHSAQWLDPMRPAPAGWYRRFMFWLSEDAEFLGRMEKPAVEKAKAVY